MTKKTSIAAIVGLAVLCTVCGLGGDARADDARRPAAPKHIVSFNLCADQLLVALADPEQIAGLSPYAADSALSVVAKEAAKFPRLDWNTESVVNLSPDLILSGPTDRPTRAILGATGLRVVEVGLISNLAAARQQARDIGALIGHPARGEALARALEQAEKKLAAVAFNPPRTALVVQRAGWTEGPQSLVAAMLTVAGLRPPPHAPAGFGGYVSMEQLLIDGPDILVLQDPPREAADQGALFITHPALLAKYGPGRRIDMPSRYALCGGPALVQGLDSLREAITKLR
jgi:iron complex transport system substrate-binding protein